MAVDAWRNETSAPENETATANFKAIDADFSENDSEFLQAGWIYKFDVGGYGVAVSLPGKTIQISKNTGPGFIGLYFYRDILAGSQSSFADVNSWIESAKASSCFKKGAETNLRPRLQLSGAVYFPKPAVNWEIDCLDRRILLKNYYTGETNLK